MADPRSHPEAGEQFEKVSTAYHQAGHLVAAVLLRQTIDTISLTSGLDVSDHISAVVDRLIAIPPRPDGHIDTAHADFAQAVASMRALVFILLAGGVAERAYLQTAQRQVRPHPRRAEHDQALVQLCLSLVGIEGGRAQETYQEIEAMAEQVFAHPRVWMVTGVVAAILAESEELDQPQTHALCEQVRVICGRRTALRVETVLALYRLEEP